MSNDTVYLLWDSSRAEHGEAPELVDIYATHEAANEAIETLGIHEDDAGVEARRVQI